MKKDNSIYVEHILECTKAILEYMDGKSKEDFLKERMLQDAVTRQIEIIGEATKNISQDFRNAHADIPWKQMAGMRDIIIHEYFDINLDVIFETASQWIPDLKGKIEKLLTNK